MINPYPDDPDAAGQPMFEARLHLMDRQMIDPAKVPWPPPTTSSSPTPAAAAASSPTTNPLLISAVQRWQHRGSYLVRWADIEAIRERRIDLHTRSHPILPPAGPQRCLRTRQ